MPCAIILFAWLGIVMILRGWRGISIPVGPRCARCDYDLTGVAGTAISRCSECGSDLRVPGAVDKKRLKPSPWRIVSGVVVFALPWLFILAQTLAQYIGPHWSRLRSNHSLIAATQNELHPDWAWYELEQRLKSGRLTKAEIPGAVDALAKYWEQTPDRFSRANTFFTTVDATGGVTAPQYLRIAHAFFGTKPVISSFPTPSNELAHLLIRFPNDGMSFSNLYAEFAIRDLTLTPDSSPIPATQPIGFHPQVRWGGFLDISKTPPGKYLANCLIDVGVIPYNTRGGIVIGNAGKPTSWPGTKAQWTVAVTVPFEVSAPVGSPQVSSVPTELKLEVGAKFDPKLTGQLSVESVEAVCFNDATLLTIHMKIDHLAVDCWVDPLITVGTNQYSGTHDGKYVSLCAGVAGPDFVWHPSFGCQFGALPNDIQTVDLLLQTDLAAPKKLNWFYRPIWGKSMSFSNLPIHRTIYPWNMPAATSRPSTKP